MTSPTGNRSHWFNAAKAALLALAVALPQSGTIEADPRGLEELQGEWTLVSVEHKGVDVTAERKLGRARMVVKNSKAIFEMPNPKETTEAQIAIVGGGKFKHIDFIQEKPGGEKDEKHIVIGIYSLEGGVLKLCVSDSGSSRPTSFSTEDPDRFLFTFQRKKSG